MYKKVSPFKTSIHVNESVIGESIEEKLQRVVHNNEPITDGAPLIYTERKDGVLPEYDPRTDRFDVAIEATEKITKTNLTKREERLKGIKGGKSDDDNKGGDVGGAESIQDTDSK